MEGMNKALITGITGQDGSYLAELLLSKGYEVHGTKRRASSLNTSRIDHIFDRLHLHYADLADESSLSRLLRDVQPDEIYNLAAQSHVAVSYEMPIYTADITGSGALKLLEAMRRECSEARFYQASSSEMFGRSPAPQCETTPFRPLSPYACAKVFAHQTAVMYREAYGLHVSCGILFNHESARRGETFVTRKIAIAVGNIRRGVQKELRLGNLYSRRDWGYAPDYVCAMWSMLQQEHPDDYVIGTGEWHTVGEFMEEAFAVAGLKWQSYVVPDVHRLRLRPLDIYCLQADARKARRELKWAPVTSFEALVRIMVEAEL